MLCNVPSNFLSYDHVFSFPLFTFLDFTHNIPHDSQLCVSDCGNTKSAHHLFLDCHFFGSVWYLVCNWLGFSSVDPVAILDQVVQFQCF